MGRGFAVRRERQVNKTLTMLDLGYHNIGVHTAWTLSRLLRSAPIRPTVRQFYCWMSLDYALKLEVSFGIDLPATTVVCCPCRNHRLWRLGQCGPLVFAQYWQRDRLSRSREDRQPKLSALRLRNHRRGRT